MPNSSYLYLISYEDHVASPPNTPVPYYVVGDEQVAERIVKVLNAGVDRESGPGGNYFYEELPYFASVANYKQWLRDAIYNIPDEEGPF